MFLRRINQKRNGQSYTYYALVETVRAPDGRVRQRTICYLGRLDNLRPPDWLRIAERLPDPAWLPLLLQEVGYAPPRRRASPSPASPSIRIPSPGAIRAASAMSTSPGAPGNCSAWIACSSVSCGAAAGACRCRLWRP